ncbi:uncharacterized protein [Procambarus clarkii]|uniref:uncharacterized protein n=1 Tax=Procambarus clarkii TaxID=6728 RepID=UPI00374374C8
MPPGSLIYKRINTLNTQYKDFASLTTSRPSEPATQTLRARHSDPQSSPLRPLELPTQTLRAHHSDPQSSPLRPSELATQTLRARHSDPQSSPLRPLELATQTSPLRPSELTTQTLRARHSDLQSSPLRPSELTTQTLRAHHSDPQSSPLKPSKLTTQTLRAHHSNLQSSPLRASELTTQTLRAHHSDPQSSPLRASELTTQTLRAHHTSLDNDGISSQDLPACPPRPPVLPNALRPDPQTVGSSDRWIINDTNTKINNAINTHLIRSNNRKPRPHPHTARGPPTKTQKTGLLTVNPGPSGQLKLLNHDLDSPNRPLHGHEQDGIIRIAADGQPKTRRQPGGDDQQTHLGRPKKRLLKDDIQEHRKRTTLRTV